MITSRGRKSETTMEDCCVVNSRANEASKLKMLKRSRDLFASFMSGVNAPLDFKRRGAEWSEYHIEVPSKTFESIGSIGSHRSRGTLMAYTDHSVQCRFVIAASVIWWVWFVTGVYSSDRLILIFLEPIPIICMFLYLILYLICRTDIYLLL